MRQVAALLAVIACAACAPVPVVLPSPSAGPCETVGLELARVLGPDPHLVAAFASTHADIASWAARGYGDPNAPTVVNNSTSPPLTRVNVCYYDGDFTNFAKAAPPPAPHYDRLRVFVEDGRAGINTAGYRDRLPVASPPHGP